MRVCLRSWLRRSWSAKPKPSAPKAGSGSRSRLEPALDHRRAPADERRGGRDLSRPQGRVRTALSIRTALSRCPWSPHSPPIVCKSSFSQAASSVSTSWTRKAMLEAVRLRLLRGTAAAFRAASTVTRATLRHTQNRTLALTPKRRGVPTAKGSEIPRVSAILLIPVIPVT